MKKKITNVFRMKWVLVGIGVFIGVFLILGIRVVAYQPDEAVHYHANFAIYINGQREQFNKSIYYTEIEESCTDQDEMTPHERAHMHDNINDVVHVEDNATTWGHFFQNLGWIVEPSVIRNADTLYLPDDQHKITFILNGEKTDYIVRRVIKDQDRLLVDYGTNSDDELAKEFKTVAATAHTYDTTQDPKSCSGHKSVTMRDRMNHMF